MQGLEDCIPLQPKERGGVRIVSFGPKLRRRGSSVTPEGSKGNKKQEKKVATVRYMNQEYLKTSRDPRRQSGKRK